MTTNKYEYGSKVVEFFKHSDEELQKIVARKTLRYYSQSESIWNEELGASVKFVSHKPLAQALTDLEEMTLLGYKVQMADYNPLLLKCTLRKPDEMIAAELPKLTEMAKAEYDELRYASNVAETQRQMELTIARRAREQAEAKAAAEAKHKADEEAFALADLLKAYTPKPKAKAKQEVAA
jgi:hypothetical protein